MDILCPVDDPNQGIPFLLVGEVLSIQSNGNDSIHQCRLYAQVIHGNSADIKNKRPDLRFGFAMCSTIGVSEDRQYEATHGMTEACSSRQ